MMLANLTVLGLVSRHHNLPLFAQSRTVLRPDISLLSSRLSKCSFPVIFSTTSHITGAIHNSKFANYLSTVIHISDQNKFQNILEATKITTGQKFWGSGPSLVIRQCYFLECFVRHSAVTGANGGAIFADVTSDFTATITECGFKNCFSEDTSGAIFTRGGNFTILGSIFTHNMAFQGSNLYAVTASTTIEHSLFKQTKFSYENDVIGHSGMLFTDSITSITNSNITNMKKYITKAAAVSVIRPTYFSLTHTKLKKLKCITALDFTEADAANVQVSNVLFLSLNSSLSIISTTSVANPIIVKSSDFRVIGVSKLFDQSVEFVDCILTKGRLEWNLPNASDTSGFLKVADAPSISIMAEANPYNMKKCWLKEKVKPTKKFTASSTFAPTDEFTPSITYSGFQFEKDGMDWEEFKRNTKVVEKVDTKMLLAQILYVLK